MKLKTRIALMLGCGLLITLLVGYNTYRTTQRLITTTNWVIHTHLVLQQIERLEAQLAHLDNDFRGFLHSDHPYFRADFDRKALEVSAQIRNLQNSTVDLLDQQNQLQDLTTLFHTKIRISTPFFKGDSLRGMTRLDSIRKFLELTERIQYILYSFKQEKEALLAEQVDASDRASTTATTMSFLGGLAALAMIVLAVRLLLQTLGTRTRHNSVLQENEQRLKQFLEAVPTAILVTDATGKAFYANKLAATTFKDLLIFNEGELQSVKKRSVNRYPSGEEYPEAERPLARALETKTYQADEVVFELDGRLVVMHYSAEPVLNAEGELQYVVISFSDLTDRIRSQERLQEAKEIAEKAAGMKENFLANMSHEIRTPLNAIIGFSNLLATSPLTEEQADYMNAVRTAGKNLLTIINDILDISKIEAGMLQLESIPFNIAALAESVRTMLQPTVTDKKLTLELQIDPTLPDLVVGDPTRLTQILLNLASNSVKFTEKGGVTVRIVNLRQDEKVVRVRFSVQDTGIGIAPEVLPHIFERFRQESGFTTRRYGGSGLGLNIVKSLTEMQGGRVEVESVPGEGSLFTVELSYTIAHDVKQETLLPGVPGAGDQARLFSVLVVEDNLVNQKLALAVLDRLGYVADVADNGEIALQKLTKKTYNIILMDIQMPVMDGYETTRQIRTKLKSSVPIIAMTAHALTGEREHCLQVGMNDFISKPFQMEELQSIIRKHLAVVTPISKATAKTMTAPTKASFNLNYLQEITGDDTNALTELLEVFLNQMPIQLNELRKGFEKSDVTAVNRAAHSLKAPVQMLGLEIAARLFAQTQDMTSKQVNLGDIKSIADEALTRVENELPAIRETLKQLQLSVESK